MKTPKCWNIFTRAILLGVVGLSLIVYCFIIFYFDLYGTDTLIIVKILWQLVVSVFHSWTKELYHCINILKIRNENEHEANWYEWWFVAQLHWDFFLVWESRPSIIIRILKKMKLQVDTRLLEHAPSILIKEKKLLLFWPKHELNNWPATQYKRKRKFEVNLQ